MNQMYNEDMISEDDVRNWVLSLSDNQLFFTLNTVSEEVKRRNNLNGPTIANIRSQSVGENIKMVMDALNGLGIQTPDPDITDLEEAPKTERSE